MGGACYILFQNVSVKLSMSPISDLWKRFQTSLVHEFTGKKAKPSRDSVLDLWSSWASYSERDSIFCISAFKKAVLTICW